MQTRILTLSWEYPPHKVGGLAEHVYELSKGLIRKGLDVHVVTLGAFPYEENAGVCLHRIALNTWGPDFINRMNEEMKRIGASIIETPNREPDILHAHDWMVSAAALDLAFKYQKPLVSTIHSTEFGRSQGIKGGYQMSIHELEEQLVRLSTHVIVCSESMKREIQDLFGAAEKISVVPNGVDVAKFDFFVDKAAIKERFCGSKDAKMILFIGRLVYQKGVNVLIGALPRILASRTGLKAELKLVIVGEGSMRPQLERDAAYLGVSNHVVFTGYLDDYTVRSLLKAADVVVLPSLYEPFGIVALEAMAARTPVVVSDVGGLSELIAHGEGIKVPPDNSDSLADALITILSDEDETIRIERERMVLRGYQKALSLNWDTIAAATIAVYSDVLAKARPGLQPARWKKVEPGVGTRAGDMWKYSYS
ncbi:MAG: glycosyltransferase family 1 protein [Methanophagales archaeon ANME-1-THS]|nr:MAG: glycosyltransferase family 1 protein [Methanophagales archaeon ANME-1-THS]